jgi:hypothetical protein
VIWHCYTLTMGPEVAFAIQRPCEIHVHMIDVPTAPREPKTWLNRRRHEDIGGLKTKNLGRGNTCTCQLFATTPTTTTKGDGYTWNTRWYL